MLCRHTIHSDTTCVPCKTPPQVQHTSHAFHLVFCICLRVPFLIIAPPPRWEQHSWDPTSAARFRKGCPQHISSSSGCTQHIQWYLQPHTLLPHKTLSHECKRPSKLHRRCCPCKHLEPQCPSGFGFQAHCCTQQSGPSCSIAHLFIKGSSSAVSCHTIQQERGLRTHGCRNRLLWPVKPPATFPT